MLKNSPIPVLAFVAHAMRFDGFDNRHPMIS
jgi:hypothetical protein